MGYMSNEDKALDNKSSATVLIVVGGIGILADLIYIFLNPFDSPSSNRLLTGGVMLALFIFFVITGIFAVKKYKQLRISVEKEYEARYKIETYFENNITADDIDESAKGFEDEGEIYYARYNFIKDKVMTLIEDMEKPDDVFIENLIDELYSDYFENHSREYTDDKL